MSPAGSRLRALTEEYRQLAAQAAAGRRRGARRQDARAGQAGAPGAGASGCSTPARPGSSSACWWPTTSTTARRPGAGVITGVGVVEGREVVVVANDATVKAGSWWPETIRKILRAQEVAMRQRIPIIYLVDSAGVNLPYQGGVFPGQYGAARIFYYNSIMRRYLHVPQISAVMGSCIAGGAYLPALSDVIFMVEGTSFMGLGGPNLVKGATGQTIDAETLGGARTHTELSAVAHYRAANDAECLDADPRVRRPAAADRRRAATGCSPPRRRPARPPTCTTCCRRITGCPTTCAQVLACLLDGGALDEFQPDVAREMICGHAHIEGWPVAVIANQRGMIKGQPGERPALRRHRLHRERREGGLLHRDREPGAAADPLRAGRERLHGGARGGAVGHHPGRARASSRRWRRRWCPRSCSPSTTPRAPGYYAMAGQGFDPDFILSWPTGRMGVMEGESAVMAVHGAEIEQGPAARSASRRAEVQASMESMRADYEQQLDARYAAARGLRGRDRHPGRDPGPARLPPADHRQLRRPAPRPVRAAAARRGHPSLGAACRRRV